jgi:hypothetical protein
MIVERIFKFIKSKGINKSEFYRITGISNGYLDKVKDVGVAKVEHILSVFPDLNPVWLVTGEGPMLKSQIEKPQETHDNSYLLEVQRKLIEKLEDENERLKKQIKRSNGYQIAAEPDS